MSKKLDKASTDLMVELKEKYGPKFAIGHDDVDTIYVYQQIKKIPKRDLPLLYEGFNVKYVYVGKIRPAVCG